MNRSDYYRLSIIGSDQFMSVGTCSMFFGVEKWIGERGRDREGEGLERKDGFVLLLV
jgi:hypothetical protein